MEIVKILGTLAFQALGTIILFLVIYYFTYPKYVKYLEQRKKHVYDTISDANEAKDLAQENLKFIDQEKKDLSITKEKILNEAKDVAENEKNIIITDAKGEAQNILAQADADAQSSREKVENEIMANVYDYVSLVSAKFVADNLDETKEQALISQAIDKVNNG